ncbi:MAG: FtsX-like permease family protein, partial [Patescibacteria group bacterium]|nr:FtsX-like permease family protein [Patescibacteria group bacterium]
LSLDVTQENEAVKLNQESVSEIEGIENIAGVYPLLTQDSQLNGNKLTSSAKVNMVNPNFFSLEGMTVSQGDFFKEGEDDKLVMSLATLQLLDINQDSFKDIDIVVKIKEKEEQEQEVTGNTNEKNDSGEKISQKIVTPAQYVERTYQISGIIEDTSSSYIYIPDSSVSDIEFKEFDKIKVKVNSTNNIEQARNKIIEKGFYVSSVSETVDQARQVFTIAQIVLSLFGIIALVVSAIGMFNTMTIALLERTQEIGIMKAIGASSFDIWKMFLTESMMIGFFGGFIGLIIGFSASQILNFGINWLAGAFGGAEVQLFFIPIWFVVFIIAFSTIIGLITGFYPARRAARLNALEALRYK